MFAILLFVLLSPAFADDAQPKCGTNEKFYPCGPCDSTCERDIACIAMCRPPGGCGCLPGYKRNAVGACIPESECPPKCGKNEKFYGCGACDSPCGKTLFCTADCRAGSCGCIPGYKRNAAGACVSPAECPKPNCPQNEKFYPCGPCDGTCTDPNPPCLAICKLDGGCGCKKNYVRGKSGKCIHVLTCWKDN